MGRTLVGRATFSAAIVGMALAQVMAGCGSTKEPGQAQGGSGGVTGGTSDGGASESGGTGDSAGDTGSGGTATSGGATVTGGAGIGSGGRITGLGGKSGAAGSGGLISFGGNGSGGAIGPTGGSLGAGGKGLGTGGGSTCLEGAPCKCKKLVGTIECSEGVETCSCPPAAECAATAAEPCFEPCGGEPFGAWVLEDSCFTATSSTTGNEGCQKLIQGTPGDNDLRLRILDGGEMQLAGIEDWSISAQVGLACLSLKTVNTCDVATFWPGGLLFSSTTSADCTKNACGVCDCTTEAQSEVQIFNDRWSREGTDLRLGFVTTPYCVTGDELWIGGTASDGEPRVSYKFKKQSCTGTPVPCTQRTTETCAQGFSCSVGFCKATTGTQQRCSTAGSLTDCGVLQGCEWDPTGCAGTAAEACDFNNCELEPGCTWGAPRERCGGEAVFCEGRELAECAGSGCALRVCQPSFDEEGQCSLLQNATECGKAPGCVFTAGACTGRSACSAQTDTAICEKLQCASGDNCGGTPTQCSTLSVANCHSVPGCRLEW